MNMRRKRRFPGRGARSPQRLPCGNRIPFGHVQRPGERRVAANCAVSARYLRNAAPKPVAARARNYAVRRRNDALSRLRRQIHAFMRGETPQRFLPADRRNPAQRFARNGP